MSRCFPFPPPGYEKKARPDDTDLLKKEKRREKKQDKEKDKEKKDTKEKREKDASEGKDKREKKERKEKHRDKKKDKDRDKDKATSITSNQKKFTEKPGGHNGEVLVQKDDWKKVTNNSSHEKRFSGKSVGVNGEKLSQNNLLAYESKDSKFVQELGKRISDGDRAVENQSTTEKFMGADRRKDEAVAGFVGKDSSALAEGKDKNKVKNGADRRMGGPWSRDESEFGGTPPLLHKLPGVVHGNFEGIHRSLDKTNEKMEGKDKAGKTESGNKNRGRKHGDKNREKKSQRKDENMDKEKKKEKLKDKLELKFAEQDTVKESQKNGHVGILNNKMPDHSKDRHIVDSTDGNLRKRKAPETNGYLHETETTLNIRPWPDSSHIPWPDSSHIPWPDSSHIPRPLVENGRVLEPSQTSTKLTANQQVVMANNHLVDKKKQNINGMIEGQPVSSSLMQLASPIKPPHPDSKYLDLILSVPKVEELPDYDDQEWLFASKKSKVGNSCSNETPQVWDKAMQIDSANICALPYVIPY